MHVRALNISHIDELINEIRSTAFMPYTRVLCIQHVKTRWTPQYTINPYTYLCGGRLSSSCNMQPAHSPKLQFTLLYKHVRALNINQ